MLQRIQTVYLLISAIAASLLIFFPIASFETVDHTTYKLFIGGLKPILENQPNSMLLLIFTPLLAALTLFSILKYKTRSFQLKVNTAALFVNMALLVSIFYYTDQISKMLIFEERFSYLVAAYFPVVSILTIILANRAIRKDEKLLKKSDRLR